MTHKSFTGWMKGRGRLLAAAGSFLLAAPAMPYAAESPQARATVVFSAAVNVGPTIDQFRAALGGGNNGGVPGHFPGGRREISWDVVPDEMAAPNFLPGDFFNSPNEPFARGAFLSTPGQGVQASADSDNPAAAAVRFGHINATYASIFKTFSGERLFSPVGSNVVDLTFFVPGTSAPATVKGFGAVYTDVDSKKTSFRYYDRDGNLLGKFKVPKANEDLSFLGVVFDEAIVARVRIEYGTTPLGPDERGRKRDVAVMDDFIFGEPQPIRDQRPPAEPQTP